MHQVIGQDRIVKSLERSLSEGRLPHACLFVGRGHVGKMTLALGLAQTLNCISEEKPCGSCDACRRILTGNHPDVQVIGLLESGDDAEGASRKGIGIGQIREMQHTISLKPYEGRYRVIIIDGADNMSEDAANALLKTLEEPPAGTVLLLLATDEEYLLTTITSRCQRFDLLPMPAPAIEQALTQGRAVPSERSRLLARLSRGCIGWAISASEDESLLDERSKALEDLISLASSDITTRFEFASQLATRFGKSRTQVRDQLTLWLEWWRDLLLAKNERWESITNIDREDTVRQHAAHCSLSEIREAIRSVQVTMQRLEQNANPRLALENLMLSIPSIPFEREISHA